MAEILAMALATDIAYCHGAFKWTFCDIPPLFLSREHLKIFDFTFWQPCGLLPHRLSGMLRAITPL